MFNLFNLKTKIRFVSERNGIRKYTLIFSRKKDSNKEVLKEILKQSYLYIYIDTSLCYLSYDQAEKKSLEIMRILESCAIDYKYRISEDTSNRDAILGSIKVSNIKRTCNIITFILPKDFNQDLLIDKLFEIECSIYTPLEDDHKEITFDKVFLNNFKTDDEKDTSFKYSMFLSEYISQFTITTKYLTQSEIEKIFLNK